jgi:orotate phosphoribosyltransferase
VTIPSAKGQREVSELVFGRHEPLPDELWWIVEDVCNNFSTTAKLIALIESYRASVAGIMCFLNRSLSVGTEYSFQEGVPFPVVATVRLPIVEYRQDDPLVRAEVLSGNVVWKPKHEWRRLASYMRGKE